MPFLETANLRLRRFTLKDRRLMLVLLNDSAYISYVADRGIRTEAEAQEYIQTKILPVSHDEGYGPYVAELKETGEAIGFCGLFRREGHPTPDIGYAVLPGFRGRGYSFEASRALADYARDVLLLEGLNGFTAPENGASIRVLQKLGMQQRRIFQMEGYKGDTAEYFVAFPKPSQLEPTAD